ncbi:hypothetical protein [Kitasatospora purpeofusca]|uniref:hypothetical protein n=1 Tax=Kitasatospora purpeofusca TaxID=67352 RepID=UPI00068B146B|nr:hypothetical protein [Kitasatospora purpeofusca]
MIDKGTDAPLDLDTMLAAAGAAARARRAPRRPGWQAEGLRRLASDYTDFGAGTYDQPGWWEAKAAAWPKLNSLSRWVINRADAPRQISFLAKTGEGGDGALVFGCLLLLTGHPRSANFWWRYAAGADNRTAAYSLYLYSLHHGDLSEAQEWFERATVPTRENDSADTIRPSLPPVDNYFRLLSLFTKNADAYGTTAAQPDVDLLAAIERLIHRDAGAEADGIAGLPDQRLADTLSAFTSHR